MATRYAVTYAGCYESAMRAGGEWGSLYDTAEEAIDAATVWLAAEPGELVAVEIDDGVLYYRDQESADADHDGSDALATVSALRPCRCGTDEDSARQDHREDCVSRQEI